MFCPPCSHELTATKRSELLGRACRGLFHTSVFSPAPSVDSGIRMPLFLAWSQNVRRLPKWMTVEFPVFLFLLPLMNENSYWVDRVSLVAFTSGAEQDCFPTRSADSVTHLGNVCRSHVSGRLPRLTPLMSQGSGQERLVQEGQGLHDSPSPEQSLMNPTVWCPGEWHQQFPPVFVRNANCG